MILLADSGSTKCDWIVLDTSGDILLKTRTRGLNPEVLNQADIEERIKENQELQKIHKSVTTLDFYGAGCGTEKSRKNLQETLSSLFPEASVTVQEDIVAAVHAATTKPGIVCILGTGSNSCYYDGEKIHFGAASLGYIVMDEASGNYFGKQLLRDYFYNKMPAKIAARFKKEFDLSADVIKTNLYKKPNPNTYLASFAEFAFSEDENNYFYNLLKAGFMDFIESHVLLFKEAREVPIHFIGSVAFFSKEIIAECMQQHNLELDNVVKRPIDGMVEYYKKHKLK